MQDRGYELPRIPLLRLFGKSECAPLCGRMSQKKGGEKHPYRRFGLPITRHPDPSNYFPNSFSRYLGE